jgi:hypothetical protein
MLAGSGRLAGQHVVQIGMSIPELEINLGLLNG